MQQMLNTAILIAAAAHDGQFDKAGKPYILHPMTVMSLLNSTDEELNCGAVLHDVIEDTAAHKVLAKRVTYAILREAGMSERVIAMVKLLTKIPGQTEEEYLEGILSSRDAMLVKKADLTTNMDLKRLKGVSEKDMKRMNKYILMFHEIETKLAEPEVVETWEAPEDFKIVSGPSYSVDGVFAALEPVLTAVDVNGAILNEGDTVEYVRRARNVYADGYSAPPPTGWKFVLGERNYDRLPQDGGDWAAFKVKDEHIGSTTWSWVRSDDVRKVDP